MHSLLYMHHHADLIIDAMAFSTPVVEHWLDNKYVKYAPEGVIC